MWDIFINIVISIVTGIIFLFITPYWVFVVRQEKDIKIKQIKERLLDILEEKTVNNIKINESIVRSLINGLEREFNVKLSIGYGYLQLLEDLELRFEKNRRSINEKTKYCEYIESLISQYLEDSKREKEYSRLPYANLIDQLETSIQENNISSSKILLKKVKAKIADNAISNDGEISIELFDVLLSPSRIVKSYLNVYKRNPLLFGIVGIIILAFYVGVVYFIVFNK